MKKLLIFIATILSFVAVNAQTTQVNQLLIKGAAGTPGGMAIPANGGLLISDANGNVSKKTVLAAIGSRVRQVNTLNDSTLQIICDSVTYTFLVRGGLTLVRQRYLDSLLAGTKKDTTFVTNTPGGTPIGYVSTNQDTIKLKAFKDSSVIARVGIDSLIRLFLSTTGVSAGTYGSPTQVPQFIVGTDGRITAVTMVTITGTGGGSPKRTLNPQTLTAYTITAADTAKYITVNTAAPATVSIPDDNTTTIPPPATIDIYQTGVAKVTISPLNGNVNVLSPRGRLKTANQYSKIQLNKISANTWIVSGDLDTATVANLSTDQSSLTGFAAALGSVSSPQSFHLSGSNLTAVAVLTAPTNYEISSDGTTYTGTFNVTPSSGLISSQQIFARIKNTAPVGAVAGNLTITSTGANPIAVALSGVVTSSPTITPSGTLSAFSAVSGTPSTSQSFTFVASSLTANVIWTAGTGMEVSINNSTFTPTVTFPQSGGNASGTVFVRVAGATSPGSYSGNIAGTSTGASTANVAYSATVTSSGGGVNDTLRVNPSDGTSNSFKAFVGGWNNVVFPNLSTGSPTATITTLMYKTGASSPITITIKGDPTVVNSFFTDNGSGWALATTTPYEDTVFRDTYTFNDPGPDTLVFNNLPTAANGYDVHIGSSRNTGTARNQTVTCTGGLSTTFDAKNNINNTINFLGVTPDGSNRIIITLNPNAQPGGGNDFQYITFIEFIKRN